MSTRYGRTWILGAAVGRDRSIAVPRRHGLLLALALTTSCTAAQVVEESVEPTPGAAESVAPTVGSLEPSASMLPDLGMPGMNLDEPAGEYGWTGALGSLRGMHRVVSSTDDPTVFRQTQLVFAVEDDCFAFGADVKPVPVTVAGLDGLYVEPYEGPGVVFVRLPDTGQRTRAYALPIGDRTLCVYLTWDPATTPDELEAARQVVESLRAQPFGPTGIRINFTLPFGWDTG